MLLDIPTSGSQTLIKSVMSPKTEQCHAEHIHFAQCEFREGSFSNFEEVSAMSPKTESLLV